jgi:hypothetical protein
MYSNPCENSGEAKENGVSNAMPLCMVLPNGMRAITVPPAYHV